MNYLEKFKLLDEIITIDLANELCTNISFKDFEEYTDCCKNKKDLKDRGEFLLERLSVNHRKDHKPNELSGGEQQRIAVCRALINEPSVVLADEPSGNLDTKNATELHELFFQLREEFQQTFVIVTHNEDLAAMADRKLTMKDGIFI